MSIRMTELLTVQPGAPVSVANQQSSYGRAGRYCVTRYYGMAARKENLVEIL